MKQLILYIFISSILTYTVHAQYYYVPYLENPGNPGNHNTQTEIQAQFLSNWTLIQGSSPSSVWSPVQTLPFSFEFNGQIVSQYKVSTSGILTFDIGAVSVPDTIPENLPSPYIPDKSICIWGMNGTGSDGGNGGGGGGGGGPKAGKTGTQANSNGLTAYKADGGAGTAQNSGDNKFRGGGGGGAASAGAPGTNFGKGGAGKHNTFYWGDTSYNHQSFSSPVASGSMTSTNIHSFSMPMLQGHTGRYCRGGSAQNSQAQEGGVSGAPNTGNGGGGGASTRKGGKGGSGICMIRHKI